MRSDLLDRRLLDYQAKLIQQLRKLSKQVKMGQVGAESRFDGVRTDVSQLHQSTKLIKLELN